MLFLLSWLWALGPGLTGQDKGPSTNLVRNGDFESNLPGKSVDFWMPTPPYPATYEVIQDPASARSGKHFLRLTPTKRDTDGNLYQFVAKVEGAKRYVATLWARGAGSSIRIFFYRYGPDLKFLESRASKPLTLTPTWQQCRLEYDMEPEVRNLACAIHVAGGPADIDDVEVHSADVQPPELPAPPEKPWRGNTFGLDHSVPPPFTPLVVAPGGVDAGGLRVECWGRQLEYAGGLLPAQITSQGKPLLAGPVKLSASVEGRELDTARATRRVISALPDVAVVETASSPVEGLTVKVLATFEFDGLARFDVSLQADRPVTLDRLAVDIPLRTEQAQLCYRHLATRENQFGSAPTQACDWPFSPVLWFGSHERGLCWFAESPAGWHNAVPGKAIQWLPSDKDRTLRIHVVDAPTRLEGKRSFTFGLLPTPTKRPPGKSLDQFVRGGPADARYIKVLYLQTRMDEDPLRYHWNAKQEAEARGLIASASERQRKTAWVQLELVRSVPGYEEHLQQWQRVPGEVYPPDFVYVCPQSSWSDLLVYALSKLQEEYGLEGFYFDTGALMPCANRRHGCGYEQDGKTEPSYPIFAIHEFKKRLYRMLVQRVGPDRAYLSSLVNSHVDIPCLTFDTAAVSGEELSGRVRDDYGAVTNPEQFAVQYDPNLWGLWHVWLPVMTASHSLATTDTLLNLALLHNTPLWLEFCDKPRVTAVLDALAAFGTHDSRFLFPWDCRKFARLSGGRCEMAMHVAGARALLVISNFSPEPSIAELTLNWTEAGLPGVPTHNEDPLTHEVLTDKNGVLSVPIGAKTFRLIAASVGPAR
jgi:hypothetical protein